LSLKEEEQRAAYTLAIKKAPQIVEQDGKKPRKKICLADVKNEYKVS